MDEKSLRLFDLMAQSVGSTDGNLRCRFANRAFAVLMGRTPEAMLGVHIQDLWGRETFEDIQPFIKRALAGEAVSFSKRLRLPSGEMHHARVDLVPDEGGGYSFVLQGLDEAERHSRDRDRLVHELDHRVNNTFQVLQSIIALEYQSAEPATGAVLEAIKARVDALALSYEFIRADQPQKGWSAALVLERVAASIGPGDSASWAATSGLSIPVEFVETFIFIAMELSRWASMEDDKASISAQLVPEGIELSAASERGVDLTTRAGAAGLSLVESLAERCGAGPLRGGIRISLIFPMRAQPEGMGRS